MHIARSYRRVVAIGLLLTIGSTAAGKYSGGNGTVDDPYQIATAADLIKLGETPDDYDKHFILTADIDLDPNLPGRMVFDKAAIAPDTNDAESGFQGTPFSGVVDGNGRRISHMTVSGESYLGLFGQLASSAQVTNVNMVDVGITGSGDYVGGLVGRNLGALIECVSKGNVAGRETVGGLVGRNHGALSGCASGGALAGRPRQSRIARVVSGGWISATMRSRVSAPSPLTDSSPTRTVLP